MISWYLQFDKPITYQKSKDTLQIKSKSQHRDESPGTNLGQWTCTMLRKT